MVPNYTLSSDWFLKADPQPWPGASVPGHPFYFDDWRIVMSHIITAEISFEVDYLRGYELADCVEGVRRNLDRAIGDGLLTGATPEIEVEEYSMAVLYDLDALSETVALHYESAIESGEITLKDIPRLLAANGLKTGSNFLDDLQGEMLREDRSSLQL